MVGNEICGYEYELGKKIFFKKLQCWDRVGMKYVGTGGDAGLWLL